MWHDNFSTAYIHTFLSSCPLVFLQPRAFAVPKIIPALLLFGPFWWGAFTRIKSVSIVALKCRSESFERCVEGANKFSPGCGSIYNEPLSRIISDPIWIFYCTWKINSPKYRTLICAAPPPSGNKENKAAAGVKMYILINFPHARTPPKHAAALPKRRRLTEILAPRREGELLPCA